VLGGYLVSYFGWQWAFFINVPLGIVAVIIAQKVLRQTPPDQQTYFDVVGFLTIAAGSAVLLYAISAVTSGDNPIMNVVFLFAGVLLLLTFVVIEVFKARRGQEPLLHLHRFRDRTFTFSALALVFVFFVRFGILFLIPIYLQTLHRESALQAGAILAALALAVMAILPIAGRLADRIGPRPIVIVGLIVLAGTAALMVTLALNTPVAMIVGMLILLGCAFGLTQQILDAAMSQIEKDELKEVANGSTLVSVLQATAAPMGVAMLSSIVQAQSQQYIRSLAIQGITGALLRQQSSLLAMHESFLIASFLALVALVAMCFVPKRAPKTTLLKMSNV